MATASVRVVEVGPRDGLQNEPAVLPTDAKVRFIDMLSDSGLRDVEVSSFVNPVRVPQLADAEAVFAAIDRRPGVRYTALVANERGLERAFASRVDGIALFTAASDEFARRNIGRSIAESLDQFASLAAAARRAGLWVRGYVSTAFACPFTGPVAHAAVLPIVSRLLEMGVDEVSVADTIGAATPDDVRRLTEALMPILPLQAFAYHFHDTRGAAVANVEEAMRSGVAVFDSSAGGLGGCPFAPGAPGNLATESLLDMLAVRGVETGVDTGRVRAAAGMLRDALRRVDNPNRPC
ncbi:MAG TPA: hydroxymethylglutaryl-CoA lyase [Chthonomonadaceae bacterium]|nr:hydroxymethylglutaryl-CoA lyase [Chthonomonadaceae bacterium]